MIGFFVNTLVLRVRVDPAQSFADLLAQVRRTALEAYEHQDVPFERLVEVLAPERSLETSPLFQVAFTVQNAPRTPFATNGLHVTPVVESSRRVRFDLEVHAFEREGQTWVRLSVCDRGGGVPEEVVGRIFDPFFTTKGRDQGTGLALAVSHGIVAEHGGALWLENQPGESATFHVELPAWAE